MSWSVLVGTVVESSGTATPTAPGGSAAGDIQLCLGEHSGEATPTLTTANGFVLLPGADVGINTPGPGGSTAAGSIFWRRWNGADGNPTIADIGNHHQWVMLSIAGAIDTGDPWDQVQTSTQASTQGVSITGATATVTGSLVVLLSAGSLPDSDTADAEFSALANSNLTNLTERVDNTISLGNGGALFVATGELAGATAWGATTVTAVNFGTRGTRFSLAIARAREERESFLISRIEHAATEAAKVTYHYGQAVDSCARSRSTTGRRRPGCWSATRRIARSSVPARRSSYPGLRAVPFERGRGPTP